MIFPLRPHPSAVHAVEGGRRVELRVVDGHVGADGAVISRFSQKRDGQSGIPGQKPGVKAHLGGEGVNGDVRRMGRQNRPLFVDGQAVRILDVDFLMVADRMARGLVVFLKENFFPCVLRPNPHLCIFLIYFPCLYVLHI